MCNFLLFYCFTYLSSNYGWKIFHPLCLKMKKFKLLSLSFSLSDLNISHVCWRNPIELSPLSTGVDSRGCCVSPLRRHIKWLHYDKHTCMALTTWGFVTCVQLCLCVLPSLWFECVWSHTIETVCTGSHSTSCEWVDSSICLFTIGRLRG
jgi:hypothetical protein